MNQQTRNTSRFITSSVRRGKGEKEYHGSFIGQFVWALLIVIFATCLAMAVSQ